MPSRRADCRNLLALAAVCVSFTCGGCLGHKVQAAAPVASAPQPDAARPMNIAPDTDASPPQPAETPAPTVSSDASAPPLTAIVKPKTPPAPPKPATEQPVSEPNPGASAHAPAPQIFPQLSAADQQSYERRTNDDLATAEKNLQQANGRQLNATQQDLLEKARSFVEQSREAGKGGDWARAQNLAEKARVLSVELVNSL